MERRCRRTEVVLIGSLQRFFCLDCSAFHFFPPLSLHLPPSSQTSEVDYNRDPGSHLGLKPGTYGAESMFERPVQCSGIPPSQVPKWSWSDLFSCPLSLAGISKNYCLFISKGTAGYLQVLDEGAPPLPHIFPLSLFVLI